MISFLSPELVTSLSVMVSWPSSPMTDPVFVVASFLASAARQTACLIVARKRVCVSRAYKICNPSRDTPPSRTTPSPASKPEG